MSDSRRILEVGQPLFAARPLPNRVQPRRRGDFPRVSAAHLDAAEKFTSPLLLGPPLCEELVDLVAHAFTEEEAGCVRRLHAMRGTSAAAVARAEGCAVEKAAAALARLANEKRAIVGSGPEGRKRYALLPLCPGMFEMVLIQPRAGLLTDWHRRFAQLFERLWETGYMNDYVGALKPAVRYLPAAAALDAHPIALPGEQFEAWIDPYKVFAVGECQCRTTMESVGKGCGREKGNCLIMGEWAAAMIERGSAREVSRPEALQIKREAEAQGLVNWMMNVASSKGQSSCSCCGCCCHAMRAVKEMNAPGMIAPPTVVPRFDLARCVYCGRCAKACPMEAIAVDSQAKTLAWASHRCIGCGQCLLQCSAQRAVALEPAAAPSSPYRGWLSLLLRAAPGAARTAWNRWRKYR